MVADRFETGDDTEERIGADGVRHLWLRVVAPGSGRIRLELRRPGSPTRSLHAPFRRHSTRSRPLTGDVTEGVTSDQKKGVIDDFQAAAA